MSEDQDQDQDRNIREYNFAIPGNTERHIPGIPGMWPFGSRVTIDDDTKEVLDVWLKPVDRPADQPSALSDQHSIDQPVEPTANALQSAPEASPDIAQSLADAVKNL